jgi:hypothetical protein
MIYSNKKYKEKNKERLREALEIYIGKAHIN